MEHKKFMDIARINFGNELVHDNIGGFKPGDIIQISEKIDGTNASIRYDEETGKLVAFSRNNILSFDKTNRGFYNHVQSLNAEEYADTPNYVVFGEWLVKHTVVYRQECYSKWYVYDIYDVESERYLSQEDVKNFCNRHNLTYVNVLYEGVFVSWEHCNTFLGTSAYTENGEGGEGIVVKNQTTLFSNHSYLPFVLKIINEKFYETKKSNHIKKIVDPQQLEAKAHAQEIVDVLVTENRVRKELYKMIDEGILPEKVTPQDMGTVARHMPKRIYDDCFKEDREYVIEAGEYFGKTCNSAVMKIVKQILFG